MQNVQVEQTRNFAIIGHSGDGKTSLGEAILHRAGATASDSSTPHYPRSSSTRRSCCSEERLGTSLQRDPERVPVADQPSGPLRFVNYT